MTSLRPSGLPVGLFLALAITPLSCLSTLYQGEPFSVATGAIVQSRDSVIDEIDGQNVQKIRNLPARYVLRPGPHVIGFSVSRAVPAILVTIRLTSKYVRVCLLAKTGHQYVTSPIFGPDRTWRPSIFDVQNGPVRIDCDHDRLFPDRAIGGAPDPRAAAALASIPPQATDAEDQAAPPAAADPSETSPSSRTDPSDTEMDETSQSDSPQPAPIRRRPVSGVPATVKLWSTQPVRPLHARPFVDIMLLNMGLSLGGETIATATNNDGNQETLTAGTGVSLGLGLMVTPVWLRDTVGLGLSGEIGLKYDSLSASNGNLSFIRYPATGTLHALIRADHRWFFLVAGGIEKHIAPTLTGSLDAGMLNVGLKSRLGGQGRIGMYIRTSDYCAFTFGLGYTSMTYDLPAGSMDGSSFNFWTNVVLAL